MLLFFWMAVIPGLSSFVVLFFALVSFHMTCLLQILSSSRLPVYYLETIGRGAIVHRLERGRRGFGA